MILSIVIGILIFGYAGWTLYRFMKRSKQGKCPACSLSDSCSSSGCGPQTAGQPKR